MSKIKIISSRKPTNRFRKVGIFGRPGYGKSMLAATAPKPLVILTEPGGADSLTEDNIIKVFGPPVSVQQMAKTLMTEDKMPKEKAEAYAKALQICYDIPRIEAFTKIALDEAIDFVCSSEAAEYETIILDSGTKASEHILTWALTTTRTKSGSENALRAYGEMSKVFDKMTDRLMALEKNYVCLFQAQELQQATSKEEDAPRVSYLVPGVAGRKSKMSLPHAFGSIWSVDRRINDQGEQEYFIRTQPEDSNGYEKTRGAGLDPTEEFHLGNAFYRWQKAD